MCLGSSFAAAMASLSPSPAAAIAAAAFPLSLRPRPWHHLFMQRCEPSTAKKALGVWNAAYTTEKAPSDEKKMGNQTSSFGPDVFVLDLAEKLEESEYAPGCNASATETLMRLRERSAESTLAFQWPSNKVEAYRFTDLRFLKDSNIEPTPLPSQDLKLKLSDLNLTSEESMRLVFVDGVILSSASSAHELPGGVFFGSISSLSDDRIRDTVTPKLGESAEWIDGDFFASLNGIGARELGVVIIPEGVKMQCPLHVLYYSSQGEQNDGEKKAYAVSCPRLLVLVGKGAELNIVEEFVGEAGKAYWANAVVEFFIEEEGQVRHSYVQNQEREAVHIKQTCIAQKELSSYHLVEAEIGSKLSRHNLHIQQLGPDTTTKVSSFLLAGQTQLQDLHSRLILSHPRGFGRQLHKCIVMHPSGHCVFDGNVKVNRYAQQTDAGQLSRSLLLAPRATVNIKPNLQIIADDVKCSHGAAISDLEEEQLFYFRARGIDPQTARSTLVFSFGAEVLQQFEYPNLQKRVEGTVKEFLKAEGAVVSTSQ